MLYLYDSVHNVILDLHGQTYDREGLLTYQKVLPHYRSVDDAREAIHSSEALKGKAVCAIHDYNLAYKWLLFVGKKGKFTVTPPREFKKFSDIPPDVVNPNVGLHCLRSKSVSSVIVSYVSNEARYQSALAYCKEYNLDPSTHLSAEAKTALGIE